MITEYDSEYELYCIKCKIPVRDGVEDENGKLACDCWEVWKEDVWMVGYPKHWQMVEYRRAASEHEIPFD